MTRRAFCIATFAIAAAILASPIASQAQNAQPACAETDKSLPAEMAGWLKKTDVGAAARTADLANGQLPVGQAVTATLHHMPEVTFAIPPEKPSDASGFGGLLALTIKDAGTYRVAVGTGAWIDVVKDGKATPTSAHGHGPDCSTIRKVVDFPLQPGRYVVQISAKTDPSIALMVWRQP